MSHDHIRFLLSKLSRVRQTGHGRWKACCPAHDDHTPSLVITAGESGQVLMHCHGCGANGLVICQALGIEPSSLFPDRGRLQTGRKAMPVLWQPQAVAQLKSSVKQLWELAALTHKEGSDERNRALTALLVASGILGGVMP